VLSLIKPLTLHLFNLLSEEAQLACVYQTGTYIARRWDGVHQAVMPNQLPAGFFVELNYDMTQNEVMHLFAFEAGSEEGRLEDYAMFVKQPDWLA
jgi:hypothetical protein